MKQLCHERSSKSFPLKIRKKEISSETWVDILNTYIDQHKDIGDMSIVLHAAVPFHIQ